MTTSLDGSRTRTWWPGPHVCPPQGLPGVKDMKEEQRMTNVSQSLTVSVALQKARSKSNSTILEILLISIDSMSPSIPMIGKNMFLTTKVICTILKFLFIFLDLGNICVFTVQRLSTFCFLTVSLLGEEHEMRNDANEVGKLTDILSNSFLMWKI